MNRRGFIGALLAIAGTASLPALVRRALPTAFTKPETRVLTALAEPGVYETDSVGPLWDGDVKFVDVPAPETARQYRFISPREFEVRFFRDGVEVPEERATIALSDNDLAMARGWLEHYAAEYGFEIHLPTGIAFTDADAERIKRSVRTRAAALTPQRA